MSPFTLNHPNFLYTQLRDIVIHSSQQRPNLDTTSEE